MSVRGPIRTRVPWNLGTWAWLGNRIAGTAIALYLIVHILVISAALRGQGSFDALLGTLRRPFFLSMELLLVLAVIFHGINGVRLILIDLGVRPRHHVRLLWAVVGIVLVIFGSGVTVSLPTIFSE